MGKNYINTIIVLGDSMRTTSRSSGKNIKIAGYILFAALTFIGSLLFMPFEVFLLSTIVVLVALRIVEKELGNFDARNVKTFKAHSTRAKRL